MHSIIPFTSYMNTRVIFGCGSIQQLRDYIENTKVKKILLMIGSKSAEESGLVDRIKSLLPSSEIVVVSGIHSHPSFQDVRSAIASVLEHQPDIIIGLGGGSVMDVAKIASVCASSSDDIEIIWNKREYDTLTKIPCMVIPTISGTGAEITPFSALYDASKKYSVDHPLFQPTIAIIDPELCVSAPFHPSFFAAFDALSQAIEGYWAIASTDESDEYAEVAIRILPSAIQDLLEDSKSISARRRIALGSLYAGATIGITRTTAPHALSYALTIQGGIPHGAAVALLLPSVFLFNYEVDEKNCTHPRGYAYVKKKIEHIAHMLIGKTSVNDAADFFTELFLKGGGVTIPSTLSVDGLMSSINGTRLKNNPRTLENDEIKHIYSHILI